MQVEISLMCVGQEKEYYSVDSNITQNFADSKVR